MRLKKRYLWVTLGALTIPAAMSLAATPAPTTEAKIVGSGAELCSSYTAYLDLTRDLANTDMETLAQRALGATEALRAGYRIEGWLGGYLSAVNELSGNEPDMIGRIGGNEAFAKKIEDLCRAEPDLHMIQALKKVMKK